MRSNNDGTFFVPEASFISDIGDDPEKMYAWLAGFAGRQVPPADR